jgi:hypothetical protein
MDDLSQGQEMIVKNLKRTPQVIKERRRSSVKENL